MTPDISAQKLFPIQRGNPIPWTLAERAYRTYADRFGTGQSLNELAARGGFAWDEFLHLYFADVNFTLSDSEVEARWDADELRQMTERALRAEEDTAALRTQHESELATIRRSVLESANLLDKAEREQRWIRVEEGLPKERERVFICVRSGEIFAAYLEDEWFRFHMRGTQYLFQPTVDVTHWKSVAAPQVAPESPLNGKEGK